MAKTYLNVRVHPRAKRQRVERTESGGFKIHVTAPPDKGRANKEVREVIASHFRVPVSQVTIFKGLRSRDKIICLEQRES